MLPTPTHTPAKPRDLRALENATRFLDELKEHFADAPARYAAFMQIMQDFKAEKLDTLGAAERVGKLLAGAPRLVGEFNTFLPPGWKLEAASDGVVVLSTPEGSKTTVASAAGVQ